MLCHVVLCDAMCGMQVDGTLCLTTQYVTPLWSKEKAEAYVDDLVATLELAAQEA
jgi:hypothetical protein